MCEDQPSVLGLDRRAAVSELNELPQLGRSMDDARIVPDDAVARRRKGDVLAVVWSERTTQRQ